MSDAGLEASADVELRAEGDRLDYRLRLLPRELTPTADRRLTGLDGSTLSITGHLPFEPTTLRIPAWEGSGYEIIEVLGSFWCQARWSCVSPSFRRQ